MSVHIVGWDSNSWSIWSYVHLWHAHVWHQKKTWQICVKRIISNNIVYVRHRDLHNVACWWSRFLKWCRCVVRLAVDKILCMCSVKTCKEMLIEPLKDKQKTERTIAIPGTPHFPNFHPLPRTSTLENFNEFQLCLWNLSKINILTSQLSMEFHKAHQTGMPFTFWNW